jgi:circadian clock protein KaiC
MIGQRVSSGIPGLDDILFGGLMKDQCYLLVGSAGTGKTIFSLQWLRQGSLQGEKGIYITLAEPEGQIQQNVASFNWRLEEIDLIDLTSQDEVPARLGEYSIFPPSEVEQTPIWQSIYQVVEERRPQRIVIDSLTQLRYLSSDEYQFRKQLLALVSFLHRQECTALLVFEPSELDREVSVALAVDGILRLRMVISPNRVIGLRSLQVEKLRGSDFMSGYHALRITDEGIQIFPHRIEEPGRIIPGQYMLSSGNQKLDELLGGGLESGTTTLISGPAGVGKSTTCMQFLTRAVQQNKRAILYTFEESEEYIIKRSRGIGLPIDEALASGALAIEVVNPARLYPDEFLSMLRTVVEQDEREVLALDSLRGYSLVMEEFGTPVAHIHNLVTYLRRQAVTTFLLYEVEYITGDLRATEFAMSHLADNIILFRYAEYASRVIKVIGCLKKRLGGFQSELRELLITSSGIQVSEKLEHLRGILTGVPSYVPGEAPR